MVDWLATRYGRRGTWLVVLGAVWMIFGVGILQQPVPPRPGVLNEYLPPLANAIGWWITGAIALWQGARGRGTDDKAGHVALYVMPAIRLLCFAAAWVLWLGSSLLTQAGWLDHPIGWAQGWYSALVWTFISLMLRIVADWPNPQEMFPAPPDAARRH